jgi:hypothetical protein
MPTMFNQTAQPTPTLVLCAIATTGTFRTTFLPGPAPDNKQQGFCLTGFLTSNSSNQSPSPKAIYYAISSHLIVPHIPHLLTAFFAVFFYPIFLPYICSAILLDPFLNIPRYLSQQYHLPSN